MKDQTLPEKIIHLEAETRRHKRRIQAMRKENAKRMRLVQELRKSLSQRRPSSAWDPRTIHNSIDNLAKEMDQMREELNLLKDRVTAVTQEPGSLNKQPEGTVTLGGLPQAKVTRPGPVQLRIPGSAIMGVPMSGRQFPRANSEIPRFTSRIIPSSEPTATEAGNHAEPEPPAEPDPIPEVPEPAPVKEKSKKQPSPFVRFFLES